MISRRQFLIGSAGVGLISTAVGVRHIGTYPEPLIELRTLSSREAHIYSILGEWMVPPTAGLPGHGGDSISLANIDRLIAEVPDATRTLLLGLPLAFEHGAILLDWGGKRLSAMTVEEMDAYMNLWITNSLLSVQQLLAALKTLYGFAYYERQDVLDAIGLPGSCSGLVQ